MKKEDKAVSFGRAVRKKSKAPVEHQEVLRPEFYQYIAEVLRAARAKTCRAVNSAMVEAYWNIGRMIIEEEQQGRKRAEYGRYLLRELSARLTREFGNSFSERNLRNFRQFYLCFPIRNTLCSELTWSHYRALMRVDNSDAREWYIKEAADQNWSVRALQRQINSLYYDRLRMSDDKTAVRQEAHEKTTALAPSPRDFIKDPYVLEFLDIPDAHPFRDAALEQAIIDKL